MSRGSVGKLLQLVSRDEHCLNHVWRPCGQQRDVGISGVQSSHRAFSEANGRSLA